jgi:hypothetical protein
VGVEQINRFPLIPFDQKYQQNESFGYVVINLFDDMIWSAGFITLLSYSLLSYTFFKRKLRNAHYINQNVYHSSQIQTAFIVGFINPKIYLPSGLSVNEQNHVLNHERVHLMRKDHLTKAMFYFAVLVYWFNPLVWLAYYLYIKDMEMSCDEIATTDYSVCEKKNYSRTLLNVSVKSQNFVMPLAFSENKTKSRIKNVLTQKKAKPFIVVVSILMVVTVLFFVSSQITKETVKNDSWRDSLYEYKTPYVGDNVKVTHIVSGLFTGELQYDYIELKTASSPYGLNIYFDFNLSELKKYQQLFIQEKLHTVFSLIENVSYVNAISDQGQITVRRADVIKTMGSDPYDTLSTKLELEMYALDPFRDGSYNRVEACYVNDSFMKNVTLSPVEDGALLSWEFHEDYCDDYIGDYTLVKTDLGNDKIEKIELSSSYRQFVFLDNGIGCRFFPPILSFT